MRTPEEIGENLKDIVRAMNSIPIEEIDHFLRSISRDEAIGPLVNPVAWRDTGRFEAASGTRRALQAIRDFKIKVSGLGSFDSISERR